MIYRLLILLGLALVGVAVWLTLAPRQSEPVTAQNSAPARPDPGYSATDALMIETGANGQPLYTLQAQHIQQDPNADIINLSTVHMTFHDSSGGEWQARADRAQAHQDVAQVDLAGAIDVFGTVAGNDKLAHILTERLRVDTRNELIRTCSGVTLHWVGMVVTAPCLVVNTKDQTVKLDAAAHGHAAR